MRSIPVLLLAAFLASVWPARAEEIDCVTTEWKLLGANHKVCVNAFDDPDIPCVTCYMSVRLFSEYPARCMQSKSTFHS